ncbi:putative NADPH reductase TAH18 [Yarrowia lipolytica]|uniref:NADPH-dependent diflavin oxidoreductase 1 n=2 Tax=Yarrowia lipolytica TaxID=4952 RepID=NDOR1_YARLI|nr:YALI0C09460p [Yarrowia lipolytica CLIB122]Q6CCH0.1 RecName: Full=NADPH-dependent diflavin oxidoreductase 1; AltName: Full=NADPH-dependent FMN and FAD-containing oxidoreductase [Yarrowia lipolytica CLIB122]RDW27241.1 putative NADPH reductase TAH18 [Yarrowia lipolytica]RDW43654.1 putative NADPH reductase TAH18 [Yarrowia lipolytica]RDW53510.1 putative NADPH reductase TAH18 [Yarrowia lipolytica]CAG81947.1 YALI0C09460p [Yarrowia lipolytica CLIB122]|eukprot:XP_501642.1 YALI0C09460p [Yarrowia lipolytica CLIB122]
MSFLLNLIPAISHTNHDEMHEPNQTHLHRHADTSPTNQHNTSHKMTTTEPIHVTTGSGESRDHTEPRHVTPTSPNALDGRRITIAYATETGNAQDFATLLGNACTRLRFESHVVQMNDLSPETLAQDVSVLVIVCSTTGQGEIPLNGKKLWKFLLRKKLPPNLLSHVTFTTFGLGDSSYPRFNWAIRKIHKRLSQLGASEVGSRGECDDMSPDSIETMYNEWQARFCESLLKAFPLPEGVEVIPGEKLLPAKFPVKVLTNKPKRDTSDADHVACTRKDVLQGTVVGNERVTAKGHFQDVRFFQIDANTEDNDMADLSRDFSKLNSDSRDLHDVSRAVSAGSSIDFSTGDTVSLFPQNSVADVDLLLRDQGWEDIADYKLDAPSLPPIEGGYVTPLTLRSLITHHLDIMGIPRQSFFTYVFHFATSERQKERLQEFSQPGEGLEDLFDYANRPRRSILEVVTEFDSLKIPLKYVLDVFPLMRPRLFSISQKAHTMPIQLCVAIVKYQTIIKRIREGVLTRWLGGLAIGQKIVFTKHSTPIPDLDNYDVIMVAPGTGVAPMRSLILSRESEKETVLFFGNRFREKDFLFQADLEKAVGDKKLNLFTSFSRDENSGGYVQQEMYRQKELVARVLCSKQGVLYVCGSSGKMPREVRITVVTCIQEVNGWTEEQAEEWVKGMEKSGRYLQETW